jgi:hypothetical protein
MQVRRRERCAGTSFAGSTGCVYVFLGPIYVSQICYLLCIVPSILTLALRSMTTSQTLHSQPQPSLYTQCHIVSSPRNNKQGTVHTHHTLRSISVSPPTTPSSSHPIIAPRARQRYEHNPSTAPFVVTREAHDSKSINPSCR